MYDLMRFLWLEVSLAVCMDVGSANDNPTNRATPDEGENGSGCRTGVARSDIQYSIRRIESSMLLNVAPVITGLLTSISRIKLT